MRISSYTNQSAEPAPALEPQPAANDRLLSGLEPTQRLSEVLSLDPLLPANAVSYLQLTLLGSPVWALLSMTRIYPGMSLGHLGKCFTVARV